MTSWTARALSTDRLQYVATEAGNTFIVGDLLGFDGLNYFLVDASNANDSEMVGMVSRVSSGDDFVLTQMGYVTGLPGPLVPGTLYYLSTAIGMGDLTPTKPTGVGEMVIPCFIAHTSTAGWFFANPGDEVQPPTQIPWTTIVANQALVINNNYWCNSGGVLTLTMPASMGTSDAIEVGCKTGGGGFILNFGAGQVCDFVNSQTSSGGTITLTTTLGVMGGSIKINCHTTNTGFMVTTSTGNFIVA